MSLSEILSMNGIRSNFRQSACRGFAASLAIASGASYAAGEVSSLRIMERQATPFSYEANGTEYLWGMGNNQILDGFTLDGQDYTYGLSADRVEIRRDDIDGVSTGEPCGVFVESLSIGENSRTQAADYPGDPAGSGNCDIAAMLASRIINRGAVDLFSNTLPDAKNIERLDYLFDYGVSVPFDSAGLDFAGHLVSEKSGNNRLQIAAILAVDEFGEPTSYGPLVVVSEVGCVDPAICYGNTDLTHSYSMLQNDLNAPQSFPVETERSREIVSTAFVSAQILGLQAGQRYFGISLFADDVDTSTHDLLDPSTFPDNTSDDFIVVGDDADIYGGLSGFFVADALNNTVGAVFIDVNGNGVPDEGESGISDISLIIYSDENGNGVIDEGTDLPLAEPVTSNMTGGFLLPGLADGNYLVLLDESDEDILPGLTLNEGSNPQIISIEGTDSTPAYFAYFNPNVPPGGDPTTVATADTFSVEQGSSGTFDVLANDIDGAGGGLTLVDVSLSPNATVSIVDDQVVYEPDDEFVGTDSFSYTLEDADGTQQSANVSVQVTDPDAPGGGTPGGEEPGTVATADTFTVDQGVTGTFDVLANDTDGAGGGLTLVDVSSSPNAAVSIVDNQIVYQPDADFVGTDSFSYTLEDADGVQQSANVSVEVTDPNAPPGEDGPGNEDSTTVALDDAFFVNQGGSASLPVLENDTDGAGGGLTLVDVSMSPNASISIIDNEVFYQPNVDFYGMDSFNYTLQDAEGTQQAASVSVNVIQFSDINNDGINDFDQCDGCTNLTLETGIHGSGIGLFSPLGIAGLLLVLMFRCGRWLRIKPDLQEVEFSK